MYATKSHSLYPIHLNILWFCINNLALMLFPQSILKKYNIQKPL